MKFIIHIGPHKTGTTYLQESFVRYRAELAERKICYPEFWGHSAHYKLLQQLQEGPSALLEEQFAALRRGKHHCVLISVEGMISLSRTSVEYLRSLIGDNDVKIVYYVRSWGGLLASSWRENVKEGTTNILPNYYYRRMAEPAKKIEMNFEIGLDVYTSVFGDDALCLMMYDSLMDIKLDLFQHFCRRMLGWNTPPKPEIGSVNASLSYEDTETIRALNAIDGAMHKRRPPQAYARRMAAGYLELKKTMPLPALKEALKLYKGTLRFDERLPILMELHQKLYDRYQHRILPPKPQHGLFFRPRLIQISYAVQDYAFRPGVVDELNELHRVLLEREAKFRANRTPAELSEEETPVTTHPGASQEVHSLGAVPQDDAPEGAPEWVQISFRNGGNSKSFAVEGWAKPEFGHCWTMASEALLDLPRPAAVGDYLVSVALRAYVVPRRLPSQRVTVEADGVPLGEARYQGAGRLNFVVPASVVAASDGPLRIRFGLPDATCPRDLNPANVDARQLGFAFQSLSGFGPLENAATTEAEFAAA